MYLNISQIHLVQILFLEEKNSVTMQIEFND